MFRLFAYLLFIALPLQATADCLPPLEGWLELRGEIVSCRSVKAPRPSGAPFLRVELRSPTATIRDCENEACPGESMYERYARALEERTLFFVQESSVETCGRLRSSQVLVAKVAYRCCDTIPHRGVCALSGALLEPIGDDS